MTRKNNKPKPPDDASNTIVDEFLERLLIFTLGTFAAFVFVACLI